MSNGVHANRRVGGTALELPVLGFGSAHLGEMYNLVDEAQSRATLEAAWDGGVRFYDTAPWYGRGLSEHRIGGFLRTKPKSQYRITTKVGRTLHRPKDMKSFSRAPWLGGLNFEVHFDYSYDGVMRSYEQALQRLALDTVDALVIHDMDALHHGDALPAFEKQLFDSGVRALEELKASGDILAFGMGINRGDQLATTAMRVPLDFTLVAMPYTLLDQASLHTGMAACLARNVSVIIGAPFASGILVTGSQAGAKYAYSQAPQEIQDKVKALETACKAHGVALPAAALQFPLAHPAVVSVIPGSARPSEVTQNIGFLAAKIPDAFWSNLKDLNLLDRDAPVPAGS
jgi:D-threo-aldose 1-dehydrogenase